MNYYKRIKDCREDSDFLQKDIANYLGVSRGTYSMYECGSNIIPLHLLDKLSIKYQVSIEYLISNTSKKGNVKNIKPMNFELLKKRLKEERIKHNLTQNQISKILNITQSHYASFENGRNVIPITRLIELSKLYKISIDYLMGKNN